MLKKKIFKYSAGFGKVLGVWVREKFLMRNGSRMNRSII